MSALDPQAQALLDAVRTSGMPPVTRIAVEEGRTRMRATYATGGRDGVRTRDLVVPGPGGGIPVRTFRVDESPAPGLVFLHGGGWVYDDLDTHALLCGTIAALAAVVVVAVDYRRAPEHPYPAALEDTVTAVRWVQDEPSALGIAGAIAVGGESAGANLAAAASLLLRDRGAPLPAAQLLLYPVTDLPTDSGSYVERGTGFSLDAAFMRRVFDAYVPDGVGRDDPYLAPLRAPDLRGLPEALVMTAEYDPLRDEGLAYARRLEAAGLLVRGWHADDQMHGFALRTGQIDRAAELVAELAHELGVLLHRAP